MSCGRQGPNRPQHLRLLVAQRLAPGGRRRLHGEISDDLQQMILDDVADDAGLLVEGAAALDAERLGHRDVHALDVLPVPDRLEKRVGEPEVQDVLHRFLAQVVIDSEDRVFGKRAMERRVERAGRLEVAPERLLDDDAGACRAAGLRERCSMVIGNALGGIAR